MAKEKQWWEVEVPRKETIEHHHTVTSRSYHKGSNMRDQMTPEQKAAFIGQRKVLIEQTSKKLKLQLGIATALCVLFLILSAYVSMNQYSAAVCYICGGLFLASVLYAVIIKVVIWWDHG